MEKSTWSLDATYPKLKMRSATRGASAGGLAAGEAVLRLRLAAWLRFPNLLLDLREAVPVHGIRFGERAGGAGLQLRALPAGLLEAGRQFPGEGLLSLPSI